MDAVEANIEIWKKTVDVQQHFNDLELRIRNFALIVTGAFLGLGGYAMKDGGFADFGGYQISSAALIIGASLLPLCAFYLMDRLWYHRLLDGAVKAGIDAEGELLKFGIKVKLGTHIKNVSPFKLWIFGKDIHSRHKMDGFYGILTLSIIALTVTLAYAVKPVKKEQLNADEGSFFGAAAQSRELDDKAALAICESYVKDLLNISLENPGSLIVDPKTGSQAVLVSGRWRLVPKC